MEITFSQLNKLTRWEAFQFLSDVLKFAESISEGMPELYTNQLAKFETAFEAYDEALVQERRIAPDGLIEADENRDYAIRKLYSIAKEYSDYRYNSAMEDAAKVLLDVFISYGTGNSIAMMGQDTETAVITNLYQEYEKSLVVQAAIMTLNLNSALDALLDSNSTFESIQNVRRNKESEFVSGVVKDARNVAQNEFMVLVDLVNVLASVEGEENYAEFKQKVTGYLKYYSNIAKRRSKKKEDDVPEEEGTEE